MTPTITSCQRCDFIATKQLSLQLHQVVHLNTKVPYECVKCGYLVSHFKFNLHILNCNEDKPYSCPKLY